MKHWGWFVGSWIVNACVVIPALGFWLNSKHRAERLQLRCTLGDLVRAVEADARFREAFAIKNSLRRARDVLSGKTE